MRGAFIHFFLQLNYWTSGLMIVRKNLYSKVDVYTGEPVVWWSDALAIVDVGDVRVPPDSVKLQIM